VAAPNNRSVQLSEAEEAEYASRLIRLDGPVTYERIENRTILGDLFEIANCLPAAFADLIFLDPPYNLTKQFGGRTFRRQSVEAYGEWLEAWLPLVLRGAKPTASVYICGEWSAGAAIQLAAQKYLQIRNRITWEREKGRGSKSNWKSASEDIYFATMSDEYFFDVQAVKLKRRVIAPYTTSAGDPKDWSENEEGRFRLTHPSNLWTDLTVPFWSMAENTEHPTQKPEKLLAKLILASSRVGEVVFDPFLGSGTASVVAKKLGRKYVGIEQNRRYCCLAEKRLERAGEDRAIQGLRTGVFVERNSGLSD
jgi:site-specific DNA-methyltransferase (adenine-specific)